MARSMIVLFILSLLLTACQPRVVEVIRTVEVTELVRVQGESTPQSRVIYITSTPEPDQEDSTVTMNFSHTSDIWTLDPQVTEDGVSIEYIENLFVNLTNFDQKSPEILPEAAQDWNISEDGLTYTFHIRSDIPWVYHNPGNGETTQEVDAEGNLRFVTSEDFLYAIRRICDPEIAAYYSSFVAPLIRGCEDMLSFDDSADIPQEMIDALGVKAPDPQTLVIELNFPASYFLSMTTMWTFAAVPRWTIEEHGADWIEAGNIVTSGRFVLSEWIHGVRHSLLRNPLIPEDLRGAGNIERIIENIVPDLKTSYALWIAHEVDVSNLPQAEVLVHAEQFPQETLHLPGNTTFYIAFRTTKPPFDEVRVRRAFSAAFDRQTYAQAVEMGLALPMIHFAPPENFGAPPIDQVGVGFDPEYARDQLAEAGYPDCTGFPPVHLVGIGGDRGKNLIEYAQGQWETNLGCSPDQIVLEQLPFQELVASIANEVPDSQVPHMWTLGWGADYPDENSWVGSILWCEAQSQVKRECNEIDEMIVAAREETNPDERIALYRQIEDAFFGQEGEFPLIPIYQPINTLAVKSWIDRKSVEFAQAQWFHWTIDWEAKQKAQGR